MSLLGKAGQRAVNSFLKMIGGKKAMLKTLQDIIISSEPDILRGMQTKHEQYKNMISPDAWHGLQYIIKPHLVQPKKGEEGTEPETVETKPRFIMAVFLVPFRVEESGQTVGDPLEGYTLDVFFNSLLEPFFLAEETASKTK